MFPSRRLVIPLAALLLAGGTAAAAPPKPLDVSQIHAEAATAEAAGKWDRALELYLHLYLDGSATPEVRERVRVCFRNLSQVQRTRDPAFQRFVLTVPAADALNLYAEALAKIEAAYADRDRAAPAKLYALGLDELDRALADPAFRRAHCPDAAEPKVAEFRQALRDAHRAKPPATVKEARHAARDLAAAAARDLGMKTPAAAVLELLCGACAGLDEGSAFVPPGGAEAAPAYLLGAYGLVLGFDAEGVRIEAVRPRSWAEGNPDFRRGRRLARVNDVPMARATPATLRAALAAPATPFGHEIELAGDTAAMRLPTPAPTVYAGEMLKDGVGYLRLAAFRDPTPRELDDALEALKMRGLRALVLDLRGNPGGSLAAGIEAARRFLAGGVVVTTRGQVPEFAGRVFSADSGLAAHDVPLVLLVDAATMSAAEVFAAAMKDNGRAAVVGTATFGKGSIQATVRLRTLDAGGADGAGALVLTVGTTMAPGGTPIHGAGVLPHVVQKDPARQLDDAIEKALELLGGMPVEMR